MDEKHKKKLAKGRKTAAEKRRRQALSKIEAYMKWWRESNRLWAQKRKGLISEEEYVKRDRILNKDIPPAPSKKEWAYYEELYC